MKALFTFLILFTSATAFAQYILKTDSVYISGKLSNYEKFRDSANSVQFIINDFAMGSQTTQRVKINTDGTYRAAILKTGVQDIYIQYNDNLEDIIVTPGEHLVVNFDAADLSNTLSFAGEGAQTNSDYKVYKAAFKKESAKWYGDKEMARFYKMSASQKDDAADVHQRSMAANFKQEEAFLKQYISSHTLSPTFVSWALADQKAEYWENLMRYTWLHPMYAKLKPADFVIPANYYDFTKDVPMNDLTLSMSSHYSYYLGEYRRMLLKQALPDKQFLKDIIPVLIKQPASFVKDVMLCQELYGSIRSKQLENIKPFIGDFTAAVQNEAYRDKVLNAYNDAVYQQNNFTLPANAQINATPKTEADSLFSKLIAKYPNKVVYVDFWATWCGPCRSEMPNAKTLRGKFAGKDVVFLYLGVQSEEKAWKAMIAELEIKGEHYLLSKNEYAALAEKFQISGIPRYILVDKNGRVADGYAKRPGDPKLTPEIDKLLAGK